MNDVPNIPLRNDIPEILLEGHNMILKEYHDGMGYTFGWPPLKGLFRGLFNTSWMARNERLAESLSFLI